MKFQKLLGKTRKAINDFNLIEDGDKIAVGLSGGKDSLTLLHLLKNYQKFSPEKFELVAITVNPGTGIDFSSLNKLCKDINIPFYEVKTRIKEIVFDVKKEKNPCSLCANLRRGALNDMAEKLGCTKVALGHHKDDALETLMLSLCYEGRINCFSPKSYMKKIKLKLIRPMVYIEEHEIKNLVKNYNFPIIKNPCPADGYTKREDMKNLIYKLNQDIPGFKKSLFSSLNNAEQLFIWDIERIKQE